jgi:glycosyltransferase involved in cell wall biosynthesis
VSHTIYSTDWQRQIFVKGYGLDIKKTSLIENYYGPKESNLDANSKVFVGSARNLVLKNFDLLKKAFAEIKKEDNEIELFTENLPFQKFMEKISKCFAVVLISLGDVSPNIILDAIRYNRPFICTKEVGIYDRIKEAGIFVDPLNKEEIKNAIKNILTDQGYKQAKEKVLNFNFVHTWEQIAKEFLEIAKQI